MSEANICIEAIRNGGKILICGNGGSAAEASHFAAELVVRYTRNRRALPCLSLCTDPSVMTACANDFGYEQVFARQVEAFGQPGDVLIALSTSGKSANVIRAIETARSMGMHVIEAARIGPTTASRQEIHLQWLHELAAAIEDAFANR